jgi:UDP-N-acetylmuramate dehydrogenase
MENNGAKISEIHGNFILNKGNANSTEIFELIDMVKDRVFEEFGLKLEEEVCYLN